MRGECVVICQPQDLSIPQDGFDKKNKTSGVMVAVDNNGYAVLCRELYRSEGKEQVVNSMPHHVKQTIVLSKQ